MNELYEKLEIVLEKHALENRHSYFQMKHFVIGKEPTLQSQMWQCLRELQSRKATIDQLNLSIEETKDQLDLVEINRIKEMYDFDKIESIYSEELKEREKIIKCRQYERKKQQLHNSLVQLKENLKFTCQEAKFFIQMFEAIHKMEPLKDYDDLNAQKEYWNERISQEINLKLLLQQPLDTELVNTALSLPEDVPVRIQTEKALEHIREQSKRRQSLESKEQNGKTQNNEL